MGLEELDPSWWKDEGVTPLMEAIRGRNTQEVERLLAGGADPNARSARGLTPLFLAAIEGDVNLAERLLAQGADPRAGAVAPPIIAAAFQGHVACVDLLLRKGADPDASEEDGVTALMRAAHRGFTEVVRVLLAAGADPNRRDPDGWTVLTWAVLNDHVPVVEALIERVPLDDRDGQGFTHLMSVSSWGRSAMLGRLLRAGANPNAISPRGWTPLILAAQRGHPDAVRLLLQGGADPNARDDTGRTALIYASARGHRACVQLFLAHGADTSIEASDGKEPLRFISLPPISRNPTLAKAASWRSWPWRLMAMVSTHRTLHGFDVGIMPGDREQQTTAFQKIDDALDLLQRCRLPWFERMRRDVRRILVSLYPAATATYIAGAHMCVLDYEYVCASGTTPVMIASSLLHEATHARLWGLGFSYGERERTRIERLCEKSELWFATRSPSATDAVRAIQRELDGLEPSWFTDAALSQRRLNAIQKLDVLPNWAFRALAWWWERRAKRRRY